MAMFGHELMKFNPQQSCMIPYMKTRKELMNKVNECGVLLFNKNLLDLLVVYQKSSNKWGLPKGYMTEHELKNKEYFNCAKRELLEETGIDLRNHRHTKYGTFIINNKLFYVIEIKALYIKAIPLDIGEIMDIKWIKKLDLFNFVRMNSCNVTLNKLF
jgi:8-oxo-dGTP pyrophosphatase MutT (NUDIX family)